MRAVTKRIDGTPASKKTKDGVFYTKDYQRLLDQQKALR